MMRSARLFLITTAVLCTALAGTGCTDFAEDHASISPEPYRLPLSDLWNVTVERSGIDDASAVLDWLRIRIDGSGSVQTIDLVITGERDGRPSACRVRLDASGSAGISTSPSDGMKTGSHPLPYLQAIEALPLRQIPFGEDGIAIEVSAAAGSTTQRNVFQLENGSLIPLESVRFATDDTRYPVAICRMQESETATSSEGSSTAVVTAEHPDPDPSCMVAFIAGDLAQAQSVEYARNGTAGIYPGGVGIYLWKDGTRTYIGGEESALLPVLSETINFSVSLVRLGVGEVPPNEIAAGKQTLKLIELELTGPRAFTAQAAGGKCCSYYPLENVESVFFVLEDSRVIDDEITPDIWIRRAGETAYRRHGTNNVEWAGIANELADPGSALPPNTALARIYYYRTPAPTLTFRPRDAS